MRRRFRNAVCLIAEADSQNNSAVSLALYCAAMEALLCRKSDDESISAQLSQRAATLLEPERQKRHDAIKYVKDIYKKRSLILHGVRVDADDDYAGRARSIATQLLRAEFQRMHYLGKLGYDPEIPDTFFNEIDNMFSGGFELLGIDASGFPTDWRIEPDHD